jgi:hypothetical protein
MVMSMAGRSIGSIDNAWKANVCAAVVSGCGEHNGQFRFVITTAITSEFDFDRFSWFRIIFTLLSSVAFAARGYVMAFVFAIGTFVTYLI